MDPAEVWILIEAKRPPKMYGALSEHDVAELYDGLKDMGHIKDGG